MDQQTIDTYNADAVRYAREWIPKTPVQIQALVRQYFAPPGIVMDVGTGTGRDLQWLRKQGFKVRGVDASKSLLELAQASNPDVLLIQDSLPELPKIEDASVNFVLCSAVLMHLQKSELTKAAHSLLRIVTPGGRVICSVRPSRESSERERDGRLYTSITNEELIAAFTSDGATVIFAQSIPAEVNERCWSTVVVERTK